MWSLISNTAQGGSFWTRRCSRVQKDPAYTFDLHV